MSRIGELPVSLPSGVEVSVAGKEISVSGPKGSLAITLPGAVSATVDGAQVVVTRESDADKAYHGLSRSLINNMVIGVSEGYTKVLEIQGVGFRASIQGASLSLSLGFASPVIYTVPETVDVVVNNNTEIVITGADKQQVGLVAARIRSFYPAEPYKGKGIRYKGEQVRRKEGKTVA